jgi:peptide/nickel transport system permease protein
MRAGLFGQLLRRPAGVSALLLLAILYLGALFAPFLAPYRPSDQSLDHSYHPPTRLFWQDGRLHAQRYQNVDPSAAVYQPLPDRSFALKWFARGHSYRLLGLIATDRHLLLPDTDDPHARLYLLGSDSTGRDVFSRLLYGARVSLSIGLIGIAITLFMGFAVGGLAGYFGGRVDFLAMRSVEFLMALPGLYLLLALRATLAPHFESDQMYLLIVVILALIGWAGTARVIRGLALAVRNRPFVLAAESLGQSTVKILFRHLLPNLSSYLLVAATLSIPAYILGEAALSFLGLGIQEPSASWGLMLSQAQNDMKVFMLNFWWLLTPGVAIFITVIAFNVLGDVLRDLVDPKMKL